MTATTTNLVTARQVPKRLLLSALALAQMLIGIDYNIVFVALPRIANLGFSEQGLQWVVSAYAIAFGGLLLLGGRLVDRYGSRTLFLLGVGLFAIGSLAGGLATSPGLLIAGRAIQGLGGAALSPAILALLASTFDEGAERNKAISIWGGAGSAGMVIGSILGGLLTQAFGWRSVFLVNLPLAIIVIGLALFSAPAPSTNHADERSDLPGAVLTVAGPVLIVLGFTWATNSGWAAPVTWILLIAAIVCFLALIVIESRTAKPLIDLALLRNPRLRIGAASTFVFMAGFGAIAYFMTLYFQQDRGLDALQTGLAFVVPCAGVLIGTHIGGRIATRGLGRSLIVGNLVGVIFTLMLALVVHDTTTWVLIMALLFALSVGQGITFTTMYATATTGTATNQQGTAGGIATTGQQLGGAIGLAVLVNITNGTTTPTRDALLTITGILAAGVLLGFAEKRVERTHQS